MTENEIIEMLEIEKSYMDSHAGRSQSEALAYAIEAVKEIQQYRAIGTVEEITNLINFLSFDDDTSILEDLRMLVEYYAIGTIEEFKAYKQGNCTNNCKHYDSAIEYVRNKAIDEFAEMLKEKYEEHNLDLCLRQNDYYSYANSCIQLENYIDKIAEQMRKEV